jgi:hypothetical protein
MDKIIKEYQIIPLGYNCFVKKYLNYIGLSQETQLFDYIGSSMWGINKFIENDYKNLFDLNEYELLQINTNKIEKIVTHKKYYFRFLHDLKDVPKKNYEIRYINNKYSKKIIKIQNRNNDDLFKSFQEKYERRIIRFKNLLNTKNKIVFTRFDEKLDDRIMYDFIKDNYNKNEIEYLNDFSNIIKKINNNLEFYIIFISKNLQNSINNNNIIILNDTENINNYENCDFKLNNLFNKNKDFLLSSIKL